MSGVLVPLANTSSRGDTSELTLGEHKFALVHVGAGGGGGGSAAVNAFMRHGQVFPAISIPAAIDSAHDASAAAATPDEEQDAAEESKMHARPSHARQQSFQLYAQEDSRQPQQPQRAGTRGGEEPPPLAVSLVQTCQRLYNTVTSSLSSLPAQFVPFGCSASPASVAPSPSAALAAQSVVRAMAVHPTLPQIALLIRDEVHCYDVFGGADAAAAAAAASSAAGASSYSSSAAHLASSLGLDRSSLVQGAWVPRVLKHPLMARSCSVAFAAPGGNILAVGTEAGVLCLWQLVSVPTAASGHAAGAAAGVAPSSISGGNIGGGGASSSSSSCRRMGAWLHVLVHPALAHVPLDHVAFSPCGRWLAVGSSATDGFVLWDVAAALASSGAGSASASSSSCAAHISKMFSSLLQPRHGLDVLQWSAEGESLLVASSPRSSSSQGMLASVLQAGVRAAKRTWTGKDHAAGAAANQHAVSDESPSTFAAEPLPSGTITVYDTTNWSHRSWTTSAPVSAACWATPSDTPSASPSSSSSSASSDTASVDSPLLLLALRGSSVIQSVHLSSCSSGVGGGGGISSSSSSLANASVRLDCRVVEGLPTTRQPSDPRAPLEAYRVGGHVANMAWSRGGARLAVTFEDTTAIATAAQKQKQNQEAKEQQQQQQQQPSQGAPELVALLALNRDRTDTFQVLPVGMIRGPVCPCRGRVHKPSSATSAASASPDAMDDDEQLESKYAEEQPVYPSLAGATEDRTCTERNVPVHLAFLNTHSPQGELLAIVWKCGQVTFVPMYFAK